MKTAWIACLAGMIMAMVGCATHQQNSPATISTGEAVQPVSPTIWPTTWPTTRPVTLIGKLVRVEGANLVICNQSGENFIVSTDPTTRFYVDVDRASLDDIQPGMEITCEALPASPRHPAGLFVAATSIGIAGRIVKIDASNLDIALTAPAHGPQTLTVVTDEETRVFIMIRKDGHARFQPGTLEQLKAGMQVKVVPPTGTVTKIFILVPDSVGPTSKPSK